MLVVFTNSTRKIAVSEKQESASLTTTEYSPLALGVIIAVVSPVFHW